MASVVRRELNVVSFVRRPEWRETDWSGHGSYPVRAASLRIMRIITHLAVRQNKCCVGKRSSFIIQPSVLDSLDIEKYPERTRYNRRMLGFKARI